MKSLGIIVVLSAIALCSCKEEAQEILLEVTAVQWAQPMNPEVGATVILEEQRLQNGVLNSFYTEVDRTSTDELGMARLQTTRSNVLSLRVRVEQEDCFDEWVELNPENLLSDGSVNHVDVAVMPQCLLQTSVTHAGEECNTSDMIYRWIPREVPNAASEVRWTCDTDWQALSPGQTYDQACWIAGGTWLLHQRYWSCIDSTYLDSVWCPPGGTLNVVLD